MSLDEYRRKRRFDRTREPAPGPRAAAGGRAIFVVQLHHASHRHYDFRLQVGDALKSWAVPKGPSLDPSVKRLAVEVEDHPLDYAAFEGEIPKGEYGGGHVATYDHGVWSTDADPEAQLAKGHLRFELHGDRLKGGWHLVRSGRSGSKPQWLLFKQDDAFASGLEADDLLEGVTPDPRGGAGVRGGKVRRTGKVAKTTKTAKAEKAAKTPATRGRRDWHAQASKLTGARDATPPRKPLPLQLAKTAVAAPDGDGWLHEAKWDGYRIQALVVDGGVGLWSRNGLDWTDRLPEIVAAVDGLGLRSAVLDGELVAGGGTQADFGLLQATLSGDANGRLSYVLFDLLHLDGVDTARASQLARKQLLERLLEGVPPPLRYSSHVVGDGPLAYARAGENGLEGILSKRVDAPHRGGRGDDWRKVKHLASDEFAVVGWTAPKGARKGFGSLLLGRATGDGGWTYAGRVGSGFSDALIDALTARLQRDARKTATVEIAHELLDADLRRAHWLAPKLVVEVAYRGIGNQGLLRQPSLKAMRGDKALDDLQRDAGDAKRARGEQVRQARAKRGDAAAKRAEGRRMAKASTRVQASGAATSIAAQRDAILAAADATVLTHPERVVFKDDRITKQDVFDYYVTVAVWLLPEIAGRPLSVVRCPQGASRPCFFQKHQTPGLDAVGTVRLKEESGSGDYLVVEDAAGLLELVQFNALEFHPWGALAGEPDLADKLVFDLDPGEGVAWRDVVDGAREVRARLREAGLESFVRTSGGKGLHVVVPLNPAVPWDQAKPFAQAFAKAMVALDPLRWLSTASKAQRRGRIFLDWLRNGRGATSVASFSLRARPGAPVAMPLRWEDLASLRSGGQFDLRNVPDRLRRLRKHPWQGFGSLRQDLSNVALAGDEA